MATKLVKTLETDTPLPEIQARWAHVALYADIMPSVRQVRSLGEQGWKWLKDDGEWLIDDVQQRPGQLISWHARCGDVDCRATVLFTPLDGGRRTRLVYTLHYPNGVGDDAVVQEIEADMLTTLRRSAGLLDRSEDLIEVPATLATQAVAAPTEEVLAQVVDSAEALQATLSDAANAWARSMTDSMKLLNPTMWSTLAKEHDAAGPLLAVQAKRQKEEVVDAASTLQA
ncbi:MAG TPA: hypothetical protein H9903_12800 [Candidatus Aquabacterium excrementipullorum]|nr:hypothetical protein [Candidatus Aquabacterium excrementipullorum]